MVVFIEGEVQLVIREVLDRVVGLLSSKNGLFRIWTVVDGAQGKACLEGLRPGHLEVGFVGAMDGLGDVDDRAGLG